MLPVELIFEHLPDMQVDGAHLPGGLDIRKILLTVVGPNGKPRQVDITNTFAEDEIFLLEDQIEDSFFEDPKEE